MPRALGLLALTVAIAAGTGPAAEAQREGTPNGGESRELVAVKALLQRLADSLAKAHAGKYAACFAPDYLERQFGSAEGRHERVRAFLRKMAVSDCAFDEIRLAPVAKRPRAYQVTCYRKATSGADRTLEKSGTETAVEFLTEFFKDVMIVDAADVERPVIEALESNVCPERKREVYAQYLKEADQEIAEIEASEDKQQLPLALVEKAHFLEELQRPLDAETCLRRAAKLAGPNSLATLALAGFLQKAAKYEEALTVLRAMEATNPGKNAEFKENLSLRIKECEEALRNKRASGAKGEAK